MIYLEYYEKNDVIDDIKKKNTVKLYSLKKKIFFFSIFTEKKDKKKWENFYVCDKLE